MIGLQALAGERIQWGLSQGVRTSDKWIENASRETLYIYVHSIDMALSIRQIKEWIPVVIVKIFHFIY